MKNKNDRSLRLGGYSMIAGIIVLAIVILVNVLMGALPTNLTHIDFTREKLYSFSQETTELLKNLDQDVTIYYLVQRGQEDTGISTLLDRYDAMSDHIRVEWKDPDLSPTFAEKYISGTLYNNSLIVESAKRFRYVSSDQIYIYTQNELYYDDSVEVTFAGESVLTSAIDYVTRDALPTLYRLTGHGEEDLPSLFVRGIELDNMACEALDLSKTDAIPENADCILINAPDRDISEREKEIILSYLQKGGKLFAATGAMETSGLVNLNDVMAQYGMKTRSGVVIETDPTRIGHRDAPYELLPDIATHEIAAPLLDEYSPVVPIAHGIQVQDDLRNGLTVTPLLTTSKNAYLKQDVTAAGSGNYDRADGDEVGAFHVAAVAEEIRDDGTRTGVIWIASSYLADTSSDLASGGANEELFLNGVNWLCGDTGSELTIHTKPLNQEVLTISAGTGTVLTVLLVGVVPAACLVTGIVVWVRRKRK